MARGQDGKSLPKFQQNLLDWFRASRRDFPWRRSHDPYRVWVSEVMLQQTRAAAVLPYYNRFLRAFPSLGALARARHESVLRAWSGLGYYSRARNLHRAAQIAVQNHRSRFPIEIDAALALPGVGRYIARAVLSIAYGQPLAVLDGNVARVIARREAIEGDLREPARWKRLQTVADRWLPPDAPGDWNQAMMELGATVCMPRRARCDTCPVRSGCLAFRLGIVDRLPERRPKPAPVRLRLAAAVLVDRQGNTLLTRTAKSDAADLGPLFSRMWQFPAVGAEGDSAAELRRYLAAKFGLCARGLQPLGKLRHTVTFRQITIEPWLLHVEKLPAAAPGRVIALDRVPKMAISSASRKIAAAALATIAPGKSPSRRP
ncbi:MAG TPA: A/G-specific adenine glycosylase [Patescibacteria group bacterium]|nr:A/G-specific adenine glycosylase [Patescibacteria group bacterium]